MFERIEPEEKHRIERGNDDREHPTNEHSLKRRPEHEQADYATGAQHHKAT